MIPSGIMQIDKIPLNNNYKVDTTKLPEINVNTNKNILPPTTDVQKELYNIVFELLDVDFSIDDNLFSIGLDSLSAIELSNSIDKKYNINISTKDILEIILLYL